MSRAGPRSRFSTSQVCCSGRGAPAAEAESRTVAIEIRDRTEVAAERRRTRGSRGSRALGRDRAAHPDAVSPRAPAPLEDVGRRVVGGLRQQIGERGRQDVGQAAARARRNRSPATTAREVERSRARVIAT